MKLIIAYAYTCCMLCTSTHAYMSTSRPQALLHVQVQVQVHTCNIANKHDYSF